MKNLPLGLAVCLLLATGCNEFGKKPTAETKAETQLSQPEKGEAKKNAPLITETMTIKKDGPKDMNVHFKFVVDYPVNGPETVTKAIKKHLFEAFGEYQGAEYSREGLDSVAAYFVNHSVAEINEYYEGERKSEVGYGFEGSIKVFENTAKYVTYLADSYLYTGGAHGMPDHHYFTIDKKTGKVLGWDDIIPKDKRQELSQLVKKAIEEQYYKGVDHHWDDVFKFALPEQAPTLTADGLLFNYAAYEIDCYAAGMPHCILPYETVKAYMQPEALNYIQ